MVKIVKVGDDWPVHEIEDLVDQMSEKGFEGIVVAGDEVEVYDGELENITIEGEELQGRFSGDSLYEVN